MPLEGNRLSLAKTAAEDFSALEHETRALATALLVMLRTTPVADGQVVLRPAAGGAIHRLDAPWCAVTRCKRGRSVTVIVALDRLDTLLVGTVWAIGTGPVDALADSARTRRTLSRLGVLPAFASLIEDVRVDDEHRIAITALGTDLVASIVPPVAAGASWTLTVERPDGHQLRRGRPLSGDAPAASDPKTLAEVVVIALCALLAHDHEAQRRATALRLIQLNPHDRDFQTVALQTQRVSFWLRTREPATRPGELITVTDLQSAATASGATLPRVMEVLRAASVLERRRNGNYVTPAALAD